MATVTNRPTPFTGNDVAATHAPANTTARQGAHAGRPRHHRRHLHRRKHVKPPAPVDGVSTPVPVRSLLTERNYAVFPPGTYFVGDLAYVFDQIFTAKEKYAYLAPIANGGFVVYSGQGLLFAAMEVSVKGDCAVPVSPGNTAVLVDNGHIGCIRLSRKAYTLDLDALRKHGQIFSIDRDVICRAEPGNFAQFGPLFADLRVQAIIQRINQNHKIDLNTWPLYMDTSSESSD